MATNPQSAAVISSRSQLARDGDSAARFQALVDILRALGYEAFHLQPRDLDALAGELDSLKPELAFSCAAGLPDGGGGEVGVQDWLAARGLPVVGSSEETIRLCLSKTALKRRFAERGVRTPAWIELPRLPPAELAALARSAAKPGQAYILKPDGAGNSAGIDEGSVVVGPEALAARAPAYVEAWGPALAEAFLGEDGSQREYTVAMVGNGAARRILPLGIAYREGGRSRIISRRVKDAHLTEVRRTEPEEAAAVAALAAAAFEAAGVLDYARCDIIAWRGALYTIEINGQPMVPDRWFRECAAAGGLDEPGYVAAIVEAALDRARAPAGGAR